MITTTISLLVAMPLLVVLGMPIAFALGVSSLACLVLLGNMPLSVVPQKVFSGVDSFPILAIPFFTLAGGLMTLGGINRRIVSISNALIGWVAGSLAIVTVVGSMIFAAISGSAVATVAAIGGMTIPVMKQEGYDGAFAAAVAASASVCGPIIPPSIPLIVYGSMLGASISELFMGSLIPGVLLGVALALTAYVVSSRRRFPRHERMGLRSALRAVRDGIWALLMPGIILGTIFFGVCTPTEASVIAVVYSLVVGLFIHREASLRGIWSVVTESAISTAVILLILGFSKVAGMLVVANHVSEAVVALIVAITSSRPGVLLLVNLLLLVVGCIMEANSAIVILTPILVPLVAKVGMNALEFGVIMSFNLCLGLLTPPVGATILLANDMAGESMNRTLQETVPFFLVGVGILALITAFPEIITYLPGVLRR